MRPGLFQTLTKHAAKLQPTPAHQEFLDGHFSSADTAKWRAFKNKLTSPKFVAAVKQDDRADPKLKRYAQMNGKHMQAKTVPTFPVPSQTSSKVYKVKFHPDINRFSCNCGDWVHKQSVKTGKHKDCKHVTMVQLELKSQGLSAKTKLAAQAAQRVAELLR